MEEADPFPRAITFDRLFAEERPGEVAEPAPLSCEDFRELPRPIEMPPLTSGEEERAPDIRLDVEPDPALDDPAVSDGMKSSDRCVEAKFLKERDGKMLRPWDDVDLS
jgi:hypothetical protein